MTAVTSTDRTRPESVLNRCVIKVLVAFLCCHVAFLDFSVGVGAFVTELIQISSFFSNDEKYYAILLFTKEVKRQFRTESLGGLTKPVVSPTDHPKSIYNRCVLVFVAFVYYTWLF